MSTINRVPYNSTIIDRIFSQMPAGFSSDPIEQDAVVFSAESNNLFKNATITKVAPYITSNFSTVQNGASTYVNTALPIIIDGTLVSGANSASFSSYRMTVVMSSTTSSTNTSPIVGQSFSAYIANSGKIVSGTIESIIGPELYVIIANLSFFVNNEIPSSSSSPLSISEVYCSSSLDVSKISFYISDSTLTISSDESAILSENIDLENYTIESLIYYFNNRYSGKSSQLLLKLADSAPSTLLEMSASILSEGSSSLEEGIIVWPRFTSQNYSLLMMFALIIKTYKKLIIGAINQTDHRLASKDWLEHWGSILGVPRSSYEQFALETSEPDIIYRERMRREVMLPKVSNESIKYLTSQATGRVISVSDGGQPFLLYSAENTLPVVVNKGYTSGEITVSGTTVSGLGSAFLTDFPTLSAVNYGKLIVDTKGYSEARQVASVSSNNTLTLSSPFLNTYTNTPIYHDSSASIASNVITSCLIYATSSATTLTVGKTQFGSIVSGKTYMYDTGDTTFLGTATLKSTPVSGYCSGFTFTVTNTYPASISGTISGNILRVTAISSGQIVIGQLFTGTGVTANSIVTAFGTGTGGLGTYYLSQSSTVTTTTSMAADATLILGQELSGVGIPDGVFITAMSTGTSGGIGTYTISPSNYSGYCAFTATIASYTMTVTAIASGSLQVGQTILAGISDTSTTIVSISKGTVANTYVCILSKNATASNPTSMTAAKSVDNLIGFAKQYPLFTSVTQATPAWTLARVLTPIFIASSTYSYVPSASISEKTITVHSTTGTAFLLNQVINGAGILSGTTLGSALAISATTTSTATVSKWHTGSFTATISGITMSVSAVATGGLEIGQNIFGTNVASNSVVLAQLAGTAGGAGTYQLSLPSTVSSSSLTSAVATAAFMATISGTTMTVTSILSGSLRVNHTINGYSTNITAISTGTSGGIGTYTLSSSTTVASSTLMIATVLPGTGDFVYSSNAVLTPGSTLAGANVDSSTKIVGPQIIAATASGSITGKTFSSSNIDGTFAPGYGLLGDGITPGTFFTSATTVNRVHTISSTPMVGISGTWAQCITGSIVGTVLTTGGTQTNTFKPGMSIFVNAFFTATISSSTMTVSAVSEGTLAIGMVVTGVGVPASTVITALASGTTGAYTISTSATISSATVMMAEFILPPNTKIVSQSSSTVFNLSASVSASFTASFSTTTMTVTAVSAGTLDIGQIVTGTSVTANSVIIAFGTGMGGAGTYTLSQTSSLSGVSCTATKTIASKQVQGWQSGPDWIVSAISSVNAIAITASTVGYQHKKAAPYNPSTAGPALTDAATLKYFLGPVTGGGSFTVTVPLADGETTVSQKVLSFVRLLVSKYKPAGIPYTIN